MSEKAMREESRLSRVDVTRDAHCSDDEMLSLCVRAISQSGRYRLVERFERRARYCQPDGSPAKRALFVDVETTGLNPAVDEIIQLALVPFEYGAADGRIFAVHDCISYLEEPSMPISDVITELTGITASAVAGQRINDAHVASVVAEADLIIAHNAAFDRRFLERRLLCFTDKPWACSRDDVPWAEQGLASTKLEWLAYKLCGMFYEAHRADSDCYMAVHLLASALPSGTRVMQALLDSARQPTVRVSASGAPFDAKEVLKSRGYHWSDGSDGSPKAWWRSVEEQALSTERDWLAESVYASRPMNCVIHSLDAKTRYSGRFPAPIQLR